MNKNFNNRNSKRQKTKCSSIFPDSQDLYKGIKKYNNIAFRNKRITVAITEINSTVINFCNFALEDFVKISNSFKFVMFNKLHQQQLRSEKFIMVLTSDAELLTTAAAY